MTTPADRPAKKYKETTFQQLRSFYETARLGTFAEAAESLQLSPTTVWLQVRALERRLDAQLIEPGRGGQLTESGQLLVDLVGPAVMALIDLPVRFAELRLQRSPRLVVVAPSRIVTEDFPSVIRDFQSRHPETRLTVREMWDDQALAQVEAGEADLAFVAGRTREPDKAWTINRWLAFEHIYDLEIILLTPPRHPLARKRRLHVADLRSYPLVNAAAGFANVNVRAVLTQQDVFVDHPLQIEALFTATALKYVQAGFGIGLTGKVKGQPPFPGVVERDMTAFFGRSPIFLVSRKGLPLRPPAQAFVEAVKAFAER